MPNPILDKVPQALKSLYHLENELRSALISGVFQGKEQATTHLAEARRHLEELLNSAQKDQINPAEPTKLDQAVPRKEGDV